GRGAFDVDPLAFGGDDLQPAFGPVLRGHGQQGAEGGGRAAQVAQGGRERRAVLVCIRACIRSSHLVPRYGGSFGRRWRVQKITLQARRIAAPLASATFPIGRELASEARSRHLTKRN